ncbi:MAG: ATP-binding cassette domain-containing protein [Syntrophorhabdales bacterium]
MDIPLLELKDVTHGMNGKRILDHVSWTVREGEHWAILGPNGAGKTSLLKIVCGYLWPNAGGTVHRNGEARIDLGTLRRSIGWVTSTLLRDIPRGEMVLDTVVSGRYAQVGLWPPPWEEPGSGDFAAAGQWLAELECSDLAERTFGTLSQGEQQKVAICRALMAAPYLLILDEPCAGMDPGARETFLSALLAVGQKRTLPCLIYVTHHPEEILPIFTRVLILKDGRVMQEGPTAEILSSRTMERLYGVSMELMKRKGRFWPVAG